MKRIILGALFDACVAGALIGLVIGVAMLATAGR